MLTGAARVNSKTNRIAFNVYYLPGPFRTDEHGLTPPLFHVIVAVGFLWRYDAASFCSAVRKGLAAATGREAGAAAESRATGAGGGRAGAVPFTVNADDEAAGALLQK